MNTSFKEDFIRGTSGASGASGVSGVSGFVGKSGVSGALGVSGASGSSGVSGAGPSGASGATGFTGPTGASGAASTSDFQGAFKFQDEDRTNTVTVTPDNEIKFWVGAYEKWRFQVYGKYVSASATPDIVLTFNGPATITNLNAWVQFVNAAGTGEATANVGIITAPGVQAEQNHGAAPDTALRVEGEVDNQYTPGYVTLDWAQRVANATAVTMQAGTHLIAHKVYSMPTSFAFLAGGTALNSDGYCWTWGSNQDGELGLNHLQQTSRPHSVVGNHAFISAVNPGNTNSYTRYGLKSDGTVWSWGDNTNGQLANNTTTKESSPISAIGNHSFIQIDGGGQFFLGLKADGSLWGCGLNSVNGGGQLGDNTTTNRSSPVSVVGGHSFVGISTTGGAIFSAAIKADGSVWTFGSDGPSLGALGLNAAGNQSSPSSVAGNHSFIAVARRNVGGAALKADGSVWCWGQGTSGQLGDNTTTTKSSPVSVVGGHSFIAIRTGVLFTLALKADGTAWAWGDNGSRQLGDNTTVDKSSPISVLGNHSFVSIATVVRTGLGLKANGEIWGWGDNTSTEPYVGNRTLGTVGSPVRVG